MIKTMETVGPVHHVEHVMGMPISFDIRPPTPPLEAIREAIAWLHHVDETFSTYKLDSPISRIGRGDLSERGASLEIQEVLSECRRLTRLTNGAFDAFAVPAPNGTHVDPSGLVKGWAIQRAAGIIVDAGAVNYCINAAGDIALGGQPEPDRPWSVGIRHPFLSDKLATTVRLAGPIAVATSAKYERGDHIIDPRSGTVANAMLSATVFGPDLGLADAYATAVFVMGEEGLDWIDDRDGYEAYVITLDETTHWTHGFERAWPYA